MNESQVRAYNEQHALIGTPTELLPVINTKSGRRDVMTRKQLGGTKGWKQYDPAKPPQITSPELSDDVLRIEAERQLLAAENAELRAKLEAKDEQSNNHPPAHVPENQAEDEKVSRGGAEKRKRGRPKKVVTDDM